MPALELASGATGAYCSSCKTAWLPDESFCRYLGTASDWPEEHAAVSPGEAPCPACRKTTLDKVIARNGASWLRCSWCHGAWIRVQALEELGHCAAEEQAESHEEHVDWMDEEAPERRQHRPESRRSLPEPSPAERAPSRGKELPTLRPDQISPPLRFAEDTFAIEVGALPICFLVAWLIRSSNFLLPEALLGIVRLCAHELGHALVGLASGRITIPFPWGYTIFFERPSPVVSLLGLLASGCLGFLSLRRKWPLLFLTSALFLGLQTYFNSLGGAGRWEQAFDLGGVIGEFVIGTWLVIAFFYRMPSQFRWDFWRFVSLAFGAYVFVTAYMQWEAIHQGQEVVPWGALLGGADDPNGDMAKLARSYGWTAPDLSAFFLHLGTICGLVIGAHYAFFTARSYLQQRRMK